MIEVKNKVIRLSNYATNALDQVLKDEARMGYTLVGTEMAKNEFGVEVMYLFFTKISK